MINDKLKLTLLILLILWLSRAVYLTIELILSGTELTLTLWESIVFLSAMCFTFVLFWDSIKKAFKLWLKIKQDKEAPIDNRRSWRTTASQEDI